MIFHLLCLFTWYVVNETKSYVVSVMKMIHSPRGIITCTKKKKGLVFPSFELRVSVQRKWDCCQIRDECHIGVS